MHFAHDLNLCFAVDSLYFCLSSSLFSSFGFYLPYHLPHIDAIFTNCSFYLFIYLSNKCFCIAIIVCDVIPNNSSQHTWGKIVERKKKPINLKESDKRRDFLCWLYFCRFEVNNTMRSYSILELFISCMRVKIFSPKYYDAVSFEIGFKVSWLVYR